MFESLTPKVGLSQLEVMRYLDSKRNSFLATVLQDHGHQSRIPDWLTEEVLSLPISIGNPLATSNSTQLGEPEPVNSLGDPDTNQPIQVRATDSELILTSICSQY